MAPKRAFGGVLRPFGGGFRGPNRERASVFSGAGRGRAGGSAVEPGRDQRVQRRGTGRCRWFCGGARRRSQRVQRRRTGAVQAGVLRRRRGRGQRVQRRGIGAGRGVQRCRRDGPAAGREGGAWPVDRRPAPSQRPLRGAKPTGRPPGRKKSVPKGRCARRQDAKKVFRGEGAPPPEHIRAQKKRTEVRSLLFLLHYSATLRASAPGCSSDAPCRATTAPHSGSPSLLRETSGSMFSCNSLSAFDFGLPVGRGHSRESLRHPEPQPLSRLAAGISAVRVAPPVKASARRPGHSSQPPGSQFSAVRGLGRPQPGTCRPCCSPLRRRGHSTTTSVWPSTCSWRISCVELT